MDNQKKQSSGWQNKCLNFFAKLAPIFCPFLLYLAIFLIIGFLAFVIFSPLSQTPSWIWGFEGVPVPQTSKPYFAAGQNFTYEISGASGSRLVQIEAMRFAGCKGVFLCDSTNAKAYSGSCENAAQIQPGVYTICIASDGFERDLHGKKAGNFISFENSTWPYYAPWMLSLDDDFSYIGNKTLALTPSNAVKKYPFSISVINKTSFLSRDAYEVSIGDEILYIDAQARILLYANYSNSSIMLVSANFFKQQ